MKPFFRKFVLLISGTLYLEVRNFGEESNIEETFLSFYW
ncbi:hypothetical protein KIS1582_3194 [Cytobacillus firmus]|uniref:Uncharacterized protein n=1 Tax=Cytobacillus firmus TaxID=1399 RepID=A0A800MV28_CYTFI|nr:hypothetical protein KIS1582_3194 [Cytobacillus firmus]